MLKRALWVITLGLAAATAWAGESWEAGKHYDVIEPALRIAEPGKVEAAEFFWYGCGHCYQFEPVINKWKKTLPEGAYFRGIPAMWGGPMQLHAKAFYAAQALGVLDQVGPAMFTTLNVDRKPLNSEKDIAALFAKFGVAEEDFSRAFNSFGVDSQVRQADATARGAKITGTPAMMINGKYMLSVRKAGGYPEMLQIADYLIAQELALQAPAGEVATTGEGAAEAATE